MTVENKLLARFTKINQQIEAYEDAANLPEHLSRERYYLYAQLSSGGGGTIPIVNQRTENFNSAIGQTVFTLLNTPLSVNWVEVNGQGQIQGLDYTIAGNALTFLNRHYQLSVEDGLSINYNFTI